MDKIFSLSILLGLISVLSYSQNDKKFFVNDKEDYVLLIDSDLHYSKRILPEAEIDVFVKTNKNQFQYTLLVSKISEHDFEKGNLLDGKYEDYYEDTCGCEISEIDLVLYNNLKPLRHFITTTREDNIFKGINASFVSGKYLYNILFLTFENDFEEQKNNFSEIMNTLIINGKTTVEGYTEYEVAE